MASSFKQCRPYLLVSSPAPRVRLTFPTRRTTDLTQVTVTVTALDAQNRKDSLFRDRVHFTSTDPQAALPDDYTCTDADAWTKTSTLTLKSAVMRTLTVTDTARPAIKTSSAAVAVN